MLTRINNHDIKPIKGGKVDSRPILGADLIPHLYCNIFFVGRKKSGKTTGLLKVLRTCTLPGFTNVIIFSSTAATDVSWQETLKGWNDKHGNPTVTYVIFRHLFDEKTGANHLEAWFDMFDREHPDYEPGAVKQQSEPKRLTHRAPPAQAPPAEAKKPKRPKVQAPETIFVFDDFSNELKNKWVAKMVREHRHYFCKVLISTQFLTDLRGLGSRSQIDIWCLYPRIDDDTLKEIAKTIGLRFDLFLKLYHFATKKDHNFLYVDRADKDIRVNFTHQFNKKLVE